MLLETRCATEVEIVSRRAIAAERGCQLSLRLRSAAPCAARRYSRQLGRARRGVRLARAGRHPRGAGAALQQLRGRAAPSSSTWSPHCADEAERCNRPPSPSSAPAQRAACWRSSSRTAGSRDHAVRAPSRHAPRADIAAGRSINLALADRGLYALKRAGVLETRAPAASSRCAAACCTTVSGATSLHALRPGRHEVIYSVSRAELNKRADDAVRARAPASPICTSIRIARRRWSRAAP